MSGIGLEGGTWTLSQAVSGSIGSQGAATDVSALRGLIGAGDRKSIQPMAERLAPGDYDQLHHFVAAGTWDRRRWRLSCWFKRTGSSVAAVRCW